MQPAKFVSFQFVTLNARVENAKGTSENQDRKQGDRSSPAQLGSWHTKLKTHSQWLKLVESSTNPPEATTQTIR